MIANNAPIVCAFLSNAHEKDTKASREAKSCQLQYNQHEPAESGVGREAYLIVDDDVNGTVGRVRGKVIQIERLHHNALKPSPAYFISNETDCLISI